MDFKTIVTTIFTDKKSWYKVSDDDKINLFFIFNRYMSKKYPRMAQFLNKPNMDKATAMDVWYHQLKKEIKIPFWFWTGPTKRKDPPIKDWKVVQDFWKLNIRDVYIMCDMFPEDFKAEVKRINAINEAQA